MNCPICQVVELRGDEMACVNCKMTGKEMEFWLTNPARNNVLGRIREMDHVLTAMLYPMGLSTWMLAIILKDGRMVTPLAVVQIDEDELGCTPAIPPLGIPWAISITTDWPAGESAFLEGTFDDDGLVEVIAGLL